MQLQVESANFANLRDSVGASCGIARWGIPYRGTRHSWAMDSRASMSGCSIPRKDDSLTRAIPLQKLCGGKWMTELLHCTCISSELWGNTDH